MLDAQAVSFDELLDRGRLRPAYQPIVDLFGAGVVGVEALARWPGLNIAPDAAFGWARTEHRLSELDEACQVAAIEGARAANLTEGVRLFINLEPSVVSPATVNRLASLTGHGLDVVVELTEHSLLQRPADLLAAVRTLRQAGCGIALDDVGAMPASVALLPFVEPDVVKLDISLVQHQPGSQQAAILTAVSAYAERSGATVLAEGIETEADRFRALSLGATLGQGWLFGRPGPIGDYPPPPRPVQIGEVRPAPVRRPFELLDPVQVRVGTKGVLLALSHQIEQQGLRLSIPPVVLATFQDRTWFTPTTAHRYTALAARCALVVVLGYDLPIRLGPNIRGVSLGADDPLRDEWVVIVVGAHYTGALIAQDVGDMGPDPDRRFMFALTHNRETVLAAARYLLERTQPA